MRKSALMIPLLSLWAGMASAAGASSEKLNVDPEALRARIATADRVTVMEHEGNKKLYDSSDPADIKAFDDALHPKVPESEYACLCEATVTLYFYKSGKQIEKIRYIAPDEIDADSFNSYTHISKPQDLLRWFGQRDIESPEKSYEGYYWEGYERGAGKKLLPPLSQAFPKYAWDYKTAVSVDLDGDGSRDVMMLGYAKDMVAVGAVMDPEKGGKPIVKMIEFGTDGTSVQRAVSGHPSKLAVYPTDEGVKEALGQLPQGYKVCDDCFQIEVDGDIDSDPMWIYWDHVTNELDWWRA